MQFRKSIADGIDGNAIRDVRLDFSGCMAATVTELGENFLSPFGRRNAAYALAF